MPATLGDHRGVIKAAVTVVNRAANKGSEGSKRGRERREGCRQGRFNGEDCLFLCLLDSFLPPLPCEEIYSKNKDLAGLDFMIQPQK